MTTPRSSKTSRSRQLLQPAPPLLPPVSLVRQYDTHRLIPSRYTIDGASVLDRLADNTAHLNHLFELDHATNERLWSEHDLLPGISAKELVFGIPNAHVVNAAFTHAHPLGSRFNGPDRGCWYAAFALTTSQAEVSFHKSLEYAEINRFEDSVTYDDYLADFSAELHDLRRASEWQPVLASDSYCDSQRLAQVLMHNESAGVIYPSVRHSGGTCVACFRPSLVGNVRKDKRYRFTWEGTPEPKIVCTTDSM